MTTVAGLDEKLLDSYRRWGHLEAQLDPLGRLLPEPHPELARGEGSELPRRWYSGSVALEFMHIPDPRRREWLQARMEIDPATVAPLSDERRAGILERLTRGETFEQILQSRYTGNKRFSLEGIVALIPLLDEVLETSAEHGLEQCVLAMSHRGRLNVMTHIVGKAPEEIFVGFEDADPRGVLGSGDVKYHLGATGEYVTRAGKTLRIHLASNPSHLEAVDPVAIGRVRAKQTRLGPNSEARVVAIVLHGDAAFAGQGIVAETLNLADVAGFRVGGTIHVVVNNLIGFTTSWRSTISSRYSTDIAKRLPIPIFHVNGEDPEAVVRVGRIAADYRAAFASDVVVDLIGYRKHGHSEVDDPTITQPILYRRLKDHPPLWKSYAQKTGANPEVLGELAAKIQGELGEAQRKATTFEKPPSLRTLPPYWDNIPEGRYDPKVEVPTGIDAARIQALTVGLTRFPDSFAIHPKVKKLLEERQKMGAGEKALDYGMAEALAFASLVTQGVPVRLSGQDSRRGTFNHRHSVLIDTETEGEYVPLKNLDPTQAFFESYDSILSEAAVLGFEYGFSRDYPEALVLWEAQFGDFANGAEIIIDQFIAAAEDKWHLLSGLVMLLPHGYEGQGPEHSSARIERYLQLAARDNIQVCQPSNAAQYFHLLRRQALRQWRKPLVVFTPKSMLRHADASSPVADLSGPRFQTVVPDAEVSGASRILFCTGKIGHELKAERKRRNDTTTAIAFLDQLYPFPATEVAAELSRHQAREVVWVQEEPANMGALNFVESRLEDVSRLDVRTIKRSAAASPATGSAKAHALEQKALLNLAFTTAG